MCTFQRNLFSVSVSTLYNWNVGVCVCSLSLSLFGDQESFGPERDITVDLPDVALHIARRRCRAPPNIVAFRVLAISANYYTSLFYELSCVPLNEDISLFYFKNKLLYIYIKERKLMMVVVVPNHLPICSQLFFLSRHRHRSEGLPEYSELLNFYIIFFFNVIIHF